MSVAPADGREDGPDGGGQAASERRTRAHAARERVGLVEAEAVHARRRLPGVRAHERFCLLAVTPNLNRMERFSEIGAGSNLDGLERSDETGAEFVVSTRKFCDDAERGQNNGEELGGLIEDLGGKDWAGYISSRKYNRWRLLTSFWIYGS